MERYREIEKSIIKKYRKEIWSKFVRAIETYELIKANDKIAVCISGGKDSFLLAKCMQELKRHGRVNFELEFIVMNPGYTETNLKKIQENAKILNIPITIFDSNIFNVVTTQTSGNPCYLCARMRRGYLYSKAQELGCNKIALGHHYDDVIETIMLSILYGAEYKTMMPKLHSDNFENMELIRPLYLVREQSIITWKNANNLEFLNCACKFTEDVENKEIVSKRKEIKQLIKSFNNKNIENNIFKSSENINMNTIIGYHKGKEKFSFLDSYNLKNYEFKNFKNQKYILEDKNQKFKIDEIIVVNNEKFKVIGIETTEDIKQIDTKLIANINELKTEEMLLIKIKKEQI